MARPTKYKPEYPKQAAKLCRLGATDKDLAEFFEVNVSTLNLWKVTYPEFSASVKMDKAVADHVVEQSLFKRATGYTHDIDDIKVIEGQVVITPTTKHYPPDSTAMIFWLKNRQPDKWRDKQEVENKTVIQHNIMPVPTANSAEEWEQASKEVHEKNFSSDGK